MPPSGIPGATRRTLVSQNLTPKPYPLRALGCFPDPSRSFLGASRGLHGLARHAADTGRCGSIGSLFVLVFPYDPSSRSSNRSLCNSVDPTDMHMALEPAAQAERTQRAQTTCSNKGKDGKQADNGQTRQCKSAFCLPLFGLQTGQIPALLQRARSGVVCVTPPIRSVEYPALRGSFVQEESVSCLPRVHRIPIEYGYPTLPTLRGSFRGGLCRAYRGCTASVSSWQFVVRLRRDNTASCQGGYRSPSGGLSARH